MNSSIKENTRVTAKNIAQIQKLLKQGEGGILTIDLYRDECPSSGCYMYLYTKAKIDRIKGKRPVQWAITTERGTKKVEGADYQTGWENDRCYTLRPRKKGEETFPDKILAKEKIAFFLGMHSTVYQSFGYTGLNLAVYIPDVGGNREHAVREGLVHIIDKVLGVRADIADTEFDDLWEYIRKDLEDGEVMRRSLIGC